MTCTSVATVTETLSQRQPLTRERGYTAAARAHGSRRPTFALPCSRARPPGKHIALAEPTARGAPAAAGAKRARRGAARAAAGAGGRRP